jgi:protein-S-isoprenylcysteine O-methyltransferase Ste14
MDEINLTIFISVLISLIVFSVIVFHKVRRDYAEQGKLTKLSSFLQVMVFVLHAQLFTCSYWDLSLIRADEYLSVSYWLKNAPEFSSSFTSLIFGSCLAVTGILILSLGFKGFESFARIDGQKVDQLISEGIYRFTRNPQIIGYGLIVLSVPFIWNSLLALIAALVYWVGTRKMIMVEEEHLHRIFDQEYGEYCKQTPRYFGTFRKLGYKV